MTPTVQVTITLPPDLDVWLDANRTGPPILVLATGPVELCLVLPADQVTAANAAATRRLADAADAFAAQVTARAPANN